MKDLDALLDDADWATEDVPICLKGSLVREFEEADGVLIAAQAELDAASSKGNIPLAGLVTDRDEALAALEAVEARMRENEITLTLTQIPRAEYMAVELGAQPPREGNQLDAMLGADTSKFYPALIEKCLVAPVMTDAQYTKLVGRLTDLQFDRIASVAVKLNREMDGTVPFSFVASVLTRSSEATSPQPVNSGSARAGSGAGRRKPAKRSGTANRGT